MGNKVEAVSEGGGGGEALLVSLLDALDDPFLDLFDGVPGVAIRGEGDLTDDPAVAPPPPPPPCCPFPSPVPSAPFTSSATQTT